MKIGILATPISVYKDKRKRIYSISLSQRSVQTWIIINPIFKCIIARRPNLILID